MPSDRPQNSIPANSVTQVGGVAPLGYRWLDGQLVVEQEEAQIRILIYELFLKHKRKKTVANILNEAGHRTRRGSKFSDTTIDRLIRDSTAKGIRTINGKIVEVESIVESDTWERANNILGSKKKPSKQSTELFSGLIYCSCGKRMVFRSSGNSYSCPSCGIKIETKIINEAFISQIKTISLEDSKSQYSIGDNWDILTKREKRILTENLVNRIVIERDTIRFQYGIRTNSLKTPSKRQQNAGATKPADAGPLNSENSALEEPLLSETEAAQLLGISRMTLHRWRKAKKIKYFQVGSRILYSKEKHLYSFLKDKEK